MVNAILILLAATMSGDPAAAVSRQTTLAVGATVSQSLRISSSAPAAVGEVSVIADSADAEVRAVGATVTRGGGDTLVTKDGSGPTTIIIEY